MDIIKDILKIKGLGEEEKEKLESILMMLRVLEIELSIDNSPKFGYLSINFKINNKTFNILVAFDPYSKNLVGVKLQINNEIDKFISIISSKTL